LFQFASMAANQAAVKKGQKQGKIKGMGGSWGWDASLESLSIVVP